LSFVINLQLSHVGSGPRIGEADCGGEHIDTGASTEQVRHSRTPDGVLMQKSLIH
jgi:hypothetical protein